MNTSGSEIKIITGNANQELAAKIAEKVGVKLSDCIVTKFSDGENICKHQRNSKRMRCFRSSIYK